MQITTPDGQFKTASSRRYVLFHRQPNGRFAVVYRTDSENNMTKRLDTDGWGRKQRFVMDQSQRTITPAVDFGRRVQSWTMTEELPPVEAPAPKPSTAERLAEKAGAYDLAFDAVAAIFDEVDLTPAQVSALEHLLEDISNRANRQRRKDR